MITRFILSNGSVCYSNFLSESERVQLKALLEQGHLSMRCGCRDDVELFYGISADYRIYPLHNGYEHSVWCSRRQAEERTSAIVYDADSNSSTVFLSFDAKVFSPARTQYVERDETAEEYVNETDDLTVAVPDAVKRKRKDMLPRCNLRQMVSIINRDTYSERLMRGKYAVLSEDYFKNALLARCKTIYLNGFGKSLRALSLEEDHVAFVYGKVEKCEETAVYIYGSEGSVYRRFVPDGIMNRAMDEFHDLYGMSVEECIGSEYSVYVAGFVYKKVSRAGNVYTCFGRPCFFLTTRNGIYAGSMIELATLENVFSFMQTHAVKFLFPDTEQANHFGVLRVEKQGKEGRIYINCAPAKKEGAVLCLSEPPTEAQLEKFFEDICF